MNEYGNPSPSEDTPDDSNLQTPQPDQPVEPEVDPHNAAARAEREEAQRQAELDAQRQEHNERVGDASQTQSETATDSPEGDSYNPQDDAAQDGVDGTQDAAIEDDSERTPNERTDESSAVDEGADQA